MVYAGAKELMRNTAEVGRVIEIDSADDLEDLPEKLGAAQVAIRAVMAGTIVLNFHTQVGSERST